MQTAIAALTAVLLVAAPLAAQKDKKHKAKKEEPAPPPVAATKAPEPPPLPTKGEVEAWLGTYTAALETVTIAWQDDQLKVELLGVPVPVDGQWHELTKPLAVTYRLTWVPERGVISLEEKHSESVHWHYELQLERDGQHLAKYERMARDPDAVLSRTYKRQPPPV